MTRWKLGKNAEAYAINFAANTDKKLILKPK